MKRPVARSASRYRGFLGAIKPAKLVHPGCWNTFRTGHPGASLEFRRDKRLAHSFGQRVQFDVGVLCASLHAPDVACSPTNCCSGWRTCWFGLHSSPGSRLCADPIDDVDLAGSNARPHTNRRGSPNRDRPTPARGTFLFAVRIRCCRHPATLVGSGGKARELCRFGHPRFRFAQSGLRSSIVANARAGRIGQTQSATPSSRPSRPGAALTRGPVRLTNPSYGYVGMSPIF
jgi:hypothetical protein